MSAVTDVPDLKGHHMRLKLSPWQAAIASSLLTVVAVVVPLSVASPSVGAAPEDPIVVKGPEAKHNEISVAKCPEGTRVAGGGYAFEDLTTTNNGRNPNFAVTRDQPLTDGTGWAISSFGEYNKHRAYALCTHP